LFAPSRRVDFTPNQKRIMLLMFLRLLVYAVVSLFLLLVGSVEWGELPFVSIIECLDSPTDFRNIVTMLKLGVGLLPVLVVWLPWHLTPRRWREDDRFRRCLVLSYLPVALAAQLLYLHVCKSSDVPLRGFYLFDIVWNMSVLPTTLLVSRWWFRGDKSDEDANFGLIWVVVFALLLGWVALLA
jgi:hypothetical protein